MRKILCKLILIITTLFILFYTNDINTWADTYTIVPGSTATLDTSGNFNVKIKSLVTPSATAVTIDTTITSIEWTNIAPTDDVTYKNLAKSGSDVLAYLDGTVVKLYTTAETIYLNQYSNNMFYNFQALETLPITASRLNTSNVTTFDSMFRNCKNLTTLDLSNWNVTNKCTRLSGMFNTCNNLETLTCDFATWDVSNVTTFMGMFQSCYKLTELDLSNWQVTNKCTNLGGMFSSCKNLETLTCDFNTWDVSNVTDFSYIFNYCQKLESLDLSNWDVSNVTDFNNMFNGCTKLTTLDLSNWQVSNKCTDLYNMFYNCRNLETLTCNFTTWDVSNVTSFSNMFYCCEKLTSLNLTNWQATNKCTNLYSMFYGCSSLENLTCDFNTWDVSNVTTFRWMFMFCQKLAALDLTNWQVTDKCTDLSQMFYYCNNLEKVKMFNTYNISSEDMLKNLFSYDMMIDNNKDGIGDDNVARKDAIKDTNSTNKQIYIKYVAPTYSVLTTGKNFNAKVKSLVKSSATYSTYDTTIKSIEWTDVAPADDVTTIKVSKSGASVIGYLDGTTVKLYTIVDTVYLNEDSSYMFYNLTVLETLPMTESKLNTSNVTNFGIIFSTCRSLITLKLTNWQITNKCTNLCSMFSNCNKLETLTCDFTTWDISNVTNFSYMFNGCKKLITLNLSNWKVTNKCTDLSGMFAECTILETLTVDFTTWDVSNCINFSNMFSWSNKLTSINISNWVFNNANLTQTFDGCMRLSELKLPNTASVISLRATFRECSKLQEIDLSNWNCSIAAYTFDSCMNAEIKLPITMEIKTNSLEYTFNLCKKLTEMPECFKQPNLDLTTVENFMKTFSYCGFTNVDLSNWITSNNVKSYYGMFSYCENLTQITGLDKLNMDNIQTKKDSYNKVLYPLALMFEKTKIKELDISDWNISLEKPFYDSGTYTYNSPHTFPSTLEKIKMCNTSNISEDNLNYLFWNCMLLDNDENGICDDDLGFRWNAIKDTNNTDKQIYIKKDFGITLDYNGGTYNEESNKVIYGSKNATSIPTNLIPVPVKENAIFKGFYDVDNNLLDTTVIPTTDITYIAKYETAEYTISYLGITDTTADKDYKTTYTSSDEDYTLPTLSKTGYIFKGWVGNGITTPTTPYVLVSGSTGNKVFTAEFEPITYKIYIHSNDLTDSNGNHIGDTEVKTVTMEYNDWDDSFNTFNNVITEMTNSGYILANDTSDYVSYLVTQVDDSDNPINGTFDDSSIRDCYGDNYGHIMINGYRKTNLTDEQNKEYHFYIINTINNIRVLNPDIRNVYDSNCHKIYYGNKLVFFMPNLGVDLMPAY